LESHDNKRDNSADEAGGSEKLCVRFFLTLFGPFKKLGAIEVFTGLLAITTTVQVWAFIQSERAVLVLDTIAVTSPENAIPIEIAIIIKNGGKSGAQGIVHATARFKPLPYPRLY
jgi:hypothetical protein